MKLRFLTPMSGPLFNADTGDVIDLADDADAARIIAAGFAEPAEQVTAKDATEKATKAPPAETR